MISGEVDTQVRKEIDKSYGRVTDEMMKKVVEIANEQGAVKALEEETRNTVKLSKEEQKQLATSLDQINSQKSALIEAIQSAVSQEKQMQQTIVAMKLGPFIERLRYEFYHVQEFAVSAVVDLDPSMDTALASFPHAEYVELTDILTTVRKLYGSTETGLPRT